MALLLTGDFIPGGSVEYFLNPADRDVVMPVPGDELRPPDRFEPGHYSYAFLDYGGTQTAPGAAPRFKYRAAEWKETVNTQGHRARRPQHRR